tara:strand:- start:263 stop:550 length:288 start_codon:yes stop_codon:yes gene_type:complete
VLFLTTIVFPLENLATSVARASTHFKSLAKPAPRPFLLVGVFIEIKIISAFSIDSFILLEKNQFLSLVFFTMSSKPGSKIGNFDKLSEFQSSILS